MLPQTVIVPLDGSQFAERAIPVARAIATQTDGHVAFLTARWDDKPGVASSYLQRTAEEQGPAETMFVQDRRASEAITLAAQATGDRIVCMTSHGRGALRWSVLGSVAEDVIRETHHPVLLVGRHCRLDWPRGFSTAVVCVDGFSVADPIVPVAAEWAKAIGLDVHVVLVIHPLDVEGATHLDKTVEAIVAQFQAQGLAARSVVLRSRLIAGEIADFATTAPDALVMMSSHSRTGFERLALGSVAMGTVAMSPSPVLVVTNP
jgi:nucleotide-binding universal stress UspA family protein